MRRAHGRSGQGWRSDLTSHVSQHSVIQGAFFVLLLSQQTTIGCDDALEGASFILPKAAASAACLLARACLAEGHASGRGILAIRHWPVLASGVRS